MTTTQENLTAIASQQFKTATLMCGACRSYHAVWPYLRITGAVGGVEADEPFLQPVLELALKPGGQNILLAGSADSGVTALVYRAVQKLGYTANMTVLDRCATPLKTCDAYASGQGIRLSTVQQDLATFEPRGDQDLVMGHSVLPFLYASARRDVLNRLLKALKPGGHLLMTLRVSPQEAHREPAHRSPQGMADFVVKSLAERGIELPCSDAEFASMVHDFYVHRSFQVTQFNDPELLSQELSALGMRVVDVRPLGFGHAHFKTPVSGWSYLAVKSH